MAKFAPFIKEETKTKTNFKIARLSLLAAFVLCVFVILVNFIINIVIYYKNAVTPVTQKVIYIILHTQTYAFLFPQLHPRCKSESSCPILFSLVSR